MDQLQKANVCVCVCLYVCVQSIESDHLRQSQGILIAVVLVVASDQTNVHCGDL